MYRCGTRKGFPAEQFKLQLGNAFSCKKTNQMPTSWRGTYHSNLMDKEVNICLFNTKQTFVKRLFLVHVCAGSYLQFIYLTYR